MGIFNFTTLISFIVLSRLIYATATIVQKK